MKAFEATYCMGVVTTGGFFKSLVVTHKKENVRGLLNEQHDEDVFNLRVEESDIDTSIYPHEQVLTTIFA